MKLTTPNQYFDEIYCLNLKRRFDKWKEVQQRFQREQIFVKRIEGIDGKQYQKEYKVFQKNHPKWRWTIGNYGVLKTFISLYENIKEAKYKKVLIFEDDVLFHKNFKVFFDKQLHLLPEDWKLWYLGGIQWKASNIEYVKNKNFYRAKSTTGNFAIAINCEIIDDIISVLKFSLHEGYYTTDQTINMYISSTFPAYVSIPNICAHDYGYSDTAMINFNEDNTKEGIAKPRKIDKLTYI